MISQYLSKGDVGVKISGTIWSNSAKTTAENLTGDTLKISWSLPSGTVNTRTATVTDAASGTWEYTTVAADLAEIGDHELQFKIINGSNVATLPADTKVFLRVTTPLDEGVPA